MSKIDLSKMSFTDLQAIAREAKELVDAKRDEELKALVDGWAQKAAASNFTPEEVVQAFKAYLPKARGKKGNAAKGSFTHVNPKNPAEGYRGRGPHPRWLKEALSSGKSLEDFAV